MSPYRGGERGVIRCPRCKKKLPPVDVATCLCGGVWVSAFAATEVLTPQERRADRVTRWWRVREPCPECGDKMMLRGDGRALFQGCDLHGYFIDADIVAHTSIARGVDHAALDRKRSDEARMQAEREQHELTALERARQRAEIERREAELARATFVRPDDVPDLDARGAVSSARQPFERQQRRERPPEAPAQVRGGSESTRDRAARLSQLLHDDAALVVALARVTNDVVAEALVERLARIERELRRLHELIARWDSSR
ncbi:MAG TPA: hypothetical protein VK427_19515 [Kofleriaceae bacterium]|nr:hypothetical protein [Kofleriaceae bacterium]